MPCLPTTPEAPHEVVKDRPVGIVIPWFGRDLRGGAELQAWELASRLARRGHAVEIITTCCRAHRADWATNHLPAGLNREPEGFDVRRFPVVGRNRTDFDRINGKLMGQPKDSLKRGLSPLDAAEETIFVDELMRSPALLDHLRIHHTDYAAFLFLPYPYFTTLRGLPMAADRAILVPCLHHESYAFLPAAARVFHQARRILFNSEGELRLAAWLFGPGILPKSLVAGEGVESPPAPENDGSVDLDALKPFVLCLGRQDVGKNTDFLARAYLGFRTRHPETPLRLVLAGPGDVALPDVSAGIVQLGVISEAAKHALLATCQALFNPSVNESYSRVIMEAWQRGRPVVAHRDCLATATAVTTGNGGWVAGGADEWVAAFEQVAGGSPEELDRLGANGRTYAAEVGSWDRAVARYEDAIRTVAVVPTPGTPPPGRGTVHQVLSNLAFGDAISNEALWIKRILVAAGFESRIYALDIDPRLGSEACLWKQGCLDPAAAVIYHHSIGSAVTHGVCQHPGPRALIYHNITPPDVLEPYLPLNSRLCREGRRHLPEIARFFPVSVGDSTYNATELAECAFSDPGVLPLCVDPAKWDQPADGALMRRLQDGCTNILFVGRISPNKRQEDLIVAFARYRMLDPTARLHLVGTPTGSNDFYLACLRRLVEKLDLTPAVNFAGLVEDPQLAAYYRTAHLFWSMSEHEGFCVPLIEAMWFDVPVLAYATGAVPETLDGAGRLFTGKDDLPALAKEAFALVHDRRVRDEILERQHRRRCAFLPRHVEPQLHHLVARLVGPFPPPAAKPEPPPPLTAIRNIAVIKLDHIGDVLLASPVFFSLKRRFPGARITAVVAPACTPVLRHNPHVDEVVPFDPPWFWRDTDRADDLHGRMTRNWENTNRMAATVFDLVVNLRSDHENVLFAASLPHRHLLSYTNDSSYVYLISHRMTRTHGMHATRQHRELLRSIGADDWCDPRLYFTESDLARAVKSDRPTRDTVVLALGAGVPLKRWAPIKFRELARRLRGRGLPVAIIGTDADARLSEEWDAALGCVNLCGAFDLNELGAYLSQVGCLVANDSAPMHIGAAAGIPVVYIIRPLVHEEYTPVGRGHVACVRPSCPDPCKGFDPADPTGTRGFCACIQSISVDEVERGVLQVLANSVASGAGHLRPPVANDAPSIVAAG